MGKYNTMTWLNEATKGIRFGPDRRAVRAELQAHIEDEMADLKRIFPDIPLREAEQRTVARMGDPEQIGRELARLHKPWLGYLWTVSRVLAAIMVALTLLVCGGQAVEDWTYARRQEKPEEGVAYQDMTLIEACYQSGVDPFGPDGPYPKDQSVTTIRTPLAALRPEDAAQAGGYRFRVEQAGLFRFQDGPEDEGTLWLFCDLRVLGWPWQPVSLDAMRRVRAVDSAGREYASSYQVYDLHMEHDGYVMTNARQSSGLEERYSLQISRIPLDAQWLKLYYDCNGVSWSLMIPFEREEGGTDG